MFKNIENIKLNISRVSHSVQEFNVQNRRNHLFAIRISGSTTYDFGNKSICSVKGTLIYIPAGYSYRVIPDRDDSFSVSINFDADMKNAKPEIYDISRFPNYDVFIRSFPKLSEEKTASSKHMCLSLFHSLISYLIDIENIAYTDKRKYKLIEPAINYIETNFTDTNIKPGELHLLCGISPAYFRRIFIGNLGLSPQKYIEEKRLVFALNVIGETNNISIAELAFRSGYKDPLYFGKVFKKKYGFSPSYYKKE